MANFMEYKSPSMREPHVCLWIVEQGKFSVVTELYKDTIKFEYNIFHSTYVHVKTEGIMAINKARGNKQVGVVSLIFLTYNALRNGQAPIKAMEGTGSSLSPIKVESELASHGPTILRVVVEVSKNTFATSGISPFFKGIDITKGELTSMPSVTSDLSMSSLKLLDGVDCLLGPSVNLLPEGTSLDALLEPPTPDVVGFLGFFLLASMVTLLYMEMFNARAINFLIVQCWLRTYFVKRPSRLKCLASTTTLLLAYT